MTAACWTGPDSVHPQAYHDPSDEPTAEPLDPSFFDFDNGDPLGKEELKGMQHIMSPAQVADIVNALTVMIYEEVTKPRLPTAAQPAQ